MRNLVDKSGTIRLLLFICSILFLSSCYKIDMVEDNSNPAYSHLIGKKFRVKEDLLAIGMCFGCPKDQPAEYIRLQKKGGYVKKMDVVSMGELKKGTIIQVVSVKITTDLIAKALSKIFKQDDYSRYVYKESGSNYLNGIPIEFRVREANSDFLEVAQ